MNFNSCKTVKIVVDALRSVYNQQSDECLLARIS